MSLKAILSYFCYQYLQTIINYNPKLKYNFSNQELWRDSQKRSSRAHYLIYSDTNIFLLLYST